MSVYVDANSHLHHDQERSLALNCPHCQVYSHITAVSVPRYSELVSARPSHVGVVYRCDSCNAPVFLRFAVKMYAANRVELANNFVELERRAREVQLHLPARRVREAVPGSAGVLFGGTLQCVRLDVPTHDAVDHPLTSARTAA